MFIGLGACLLYFTCVGFFIANPKRSHLHTVNGSAKARFLVRLCMGVTLLVTLYIHSYAMGLERGIAVWLGLLAVVGAVSLWVSALLPKYHLLTGQVALAVALIMAVSIWL